MLISVIVLDVESRESEESEADAVNVSKHQRNPTLILIKLICMQKKLHHWVCCMKSSRMQYMMEMDQEYSDVESTCFDIQSCKTKKKNKKKKNYLIKAFRLLAQQKFILSPCLSHQLVWSQFVNINGKEGHNIPCNLHMEHLNRVLKETSRS